MFLGLMNLFIFSVSTTLKSYDYIITQQKIYVNKMFSSNFSKGRNLDIV